MKTGKDSVKRTFAKDRCFKKDARTSDYSRTHWCVRWIAVGILQRRSEGNWSGVYPDTTTLAACTSEEGTEGERRYPQSISHHPRPSVS